MRNILIACLLLVSFVAHAQSPAVPSERVLKALTLESMQAFGKAVAAKDFTAFHKQISELWREQITPAKLKSIFQTFIEQEIDLDPVLQMDPEFDQPAVIDEDGVLVIQGRYDTRPSGVQFRLKYVNEKSAWKLVGIKVDVKPTGAPGGKVPSEREARTLALESLLAFNRAVQAKTSPPSTSRSQMSGGSRSRRRNCGKHSSRSSSRRSTSRRSLTCSRCSSPRRASMKTSFCC